VAQVAVVALWQVDLMVVVLVVQLTMLVVLKWLAQVPVVAEAGAHPAEVGLDKVDKQGAKQLT
jgi:hypothetical protein